MKNNKKIGFIFAIILVILAVLASIIIYILNEKKVDFNITTNYFVTKIRDIMDNEEKYIYKRVSFYGYVTYDEKGSLYVARTYIGTDGTTKVGFWCKNCKENFKESEWVKVVGIIEYEISDYKLGNKVPYIRIESIEKAKEQLDDRRVYN